jgi:hypothetical protein
VKEGPLPQDDDDCGGGGGSPSYICCPMGEGADMSYVRLDPVCRIRHSEVVLVDQTLCAYGCTWLRLRWPGEQGGFGGFVALSNIDHGKDDDDCTNMPRGRTARWHGVREAKMTGMRSTSRIKE